MQLLGKLGWTTVRRISLVLATVFIVLDANGQNTIWRITKAWRYGASNKQLTSFVLETARVFDAHNVSYWLDDGTLLGALRDGGPILSDYDADISILGDEREMKRAFLALKAGLPPHLRAEICYYIGHPKVECHGEWVWDDLPPRVPDLYLNALNIEVCEAHAAECHNPDLDIFPCSVSPDGELVGSTSRLYRYPTLDECLNTPNTVAWLSINENHRWKPAHHQYLPAPAKYVFPLGRLRFGPRMLPVPFDTPAYLHYRYGSLKAGAEFDEESGLFVARRRYLPFLSPRWWFPTVFNDGIDW